MGLTSIQIIRLESSTDPSGGLTTYTNDVLGRVTAEFDPLGDETTTAYDAGGRASVTVTNAQLPSGQQTTRTTIYDWRGLPLWVSLNGTLVADYAYNFQGQPVTISDSNGYLELHYDAAGNVIGTRDGTSPSANYITYTYDLLNRRTQAQSYVSTQQGVSASLALTTFAYDLDSELISTTDRDGRRRDFSYDALGRVTEENWFNSSGTQVATITSSRDLLNDVTSVTNAAGTVTFSYDQYNRPQSSTDVWGITLTNTYNQADQRTGLADSTGGLETWTYDPTSGRLTEVTASEPSSPFALISYAYNGNSQVSERTYGGTGTPIITDYGYNGAGQTTTISVYTATRNIEMVTYAYDVNTGLASGMTRTAWRTPGDPYYNPASPNTTPASTTANETDPTFSGVVTFTNDGKGQITAYGNVTFSYDGNGNLNPSGTQIGAGNRLLQDTLWNYQYDLEGNLIGKTARSGSDVWNYTYDNLNRLTHAVETTNYYGTTYTLSNATYAYDGMGRLVLMQDQGWTLTPGIGTFTYAQTTNTTLHESYDGSVLLFDLSSSNAVVSRYTMDPATGQVLARQDAGTSNLYWYVADNQGTIIDLLDTTGAVRKRYNDGAFAATNLYLALANVLGGYLTGWVYNSNGTWTQVDWTPGSAVRDRFSYAGQQFDALTSLTYTGQGWYSQDIGRFINEQSGGIHATNAYRYPNNSPVNVLVVPPASRDFLEAASNFFAGAADTLTAGLTKGLRQAWDIDTVNYQTAAYGLGSTAGHALNVGLMFVNPAEVGGVLGSAAGTINTAASVGNTITGIQAYSEDRVWDSLLAFAGAGLSLLRGVSPCSWAGTIDKWGQKALHGVFVATNVSGAVERFQEGDILGALVDLADAGANAYRFGQSCHIEGTYLRTPAGLKLVEEIEENVDELLSRSEFEPEGRIEAKRVLKKFIRTAVIWHLQVNGKVLGTTAEHPYYVEGKGWWPTAMLQVGDRICGEENASWVTVEAVKETGEVKTVYNFQIADYHTYFVSGQDWGFSVWAHNYPSNEDEEKPPSTPRRSTLWDAHPFEEYVGRITETFTIDPSTPGRSTREYQGDVNDTVLYLIRDSVTGQVMKVGSTTIGNLNGRVEGYMSTLENNNVVIDVLRFEKPSGILTETDPTRSAMEKSLRVTMRTQGHQLPLDRQGSFDPSSLPESPHSALPPYP